MWMKRSIICGSITPMSASILGYVGNVKEWAAGD
jgi:hypothetical protein